MMEFEYDEGHYTRDWDLLWGVVQEWADISTRFGFRGRTRQERIRPHAEEILAEAGPWCSVRRVRMSLQQDPILFRAIAFWFENMRPQERDGFSLQEVYPAMLLRILWMVCRNADEWYESGRRQNDVHWARYHTALRFRDELRRAVRDLQQLRPLGDPPEDRGNRMEMLESLLRGATEAQALVVREYYRSCENSTDEELDELARRHGLAGRAELNRLLRRLAEQVTCQDTERE